MKSAGARCCSERSSFVPLFVPAHFAKHFSVIFLREAQAQGTKRASLRGKDAAVSAARKQLALSLRRNFLPKLLAEEK